MFEVRETPDKKLRVYTSYVAQSLEQMRNATPLTAATRRPRARRCGFRAAAAAIPGFPCTIEEFAVTDAQRARSRLRRVTLGDVPP